MFSNDAVSSKRSPSVPSSCKATKYAPQHAEASRPCIMPVIEHWCSLALLCMLMKALFASILDHNASRTASCHPVWHNQILQRTSARKQQLRRALAQPDRRSWLGLLSWDTNACSVPLPGSSSSFRPSFRRVMLVRTNAVCSWGSGCSPALSRNLLNSTALHSTHHGFLKAPTFTSAPWPLTTSMHKCIYRAAPQRRRHIGGRRLTR